MTFSKNGSAALSASADLPSRSKQPSRFKIASKAGLVRYFVPMSLSFCGPGRHANIDRPSG
eukprot:5030546-Prorocentrum_lima.AAC.1